MERVQVTPVNASASTQSIIVAIDRFLGARGYHHVDLHDDHIQTTPSQGYDYGGYLPGFHPVYSYTRFRGGYFRLFTNAKHSLVVTRWYGYIPPVTWPSSSADQDSDDLLRYIESHHDGFTVHNIKFLNVKE
jgi:hypothetical protein